METYYPLNTRMPSRDFMLKVNGKDVVVNGTSIGSFAVIEAEEDIVSVEVINCSVNPIFDVKVRPLSLGIQPKLQDEPELLKRHSIFFDLPVPSRVSVELDGRLDMPLFLFAYKGKAERPEGEKVRVYEAGSHEVDEIHLGDGETLYLAEGAWVYGNVFVEGDDVRICGRGVLSGERFPMGRQCGKGHSMIVAKGCKNLVIEDITILDGPGWHVVPSGCTNLRISGMNILGRVRSGDGIDLCCCQDVLVEGCFIRVHDDCIVLKGIHDPEKRDIRNVLARNCVLFNWEGGNAIEIGYENGCKQIYDVTFRDIDVIHSLWEGLGSGAVISIHNGNIAHVHDVLFEDIRVEDAREKLFDLKMLTAIWNPGCVGGPVTDITFRNIRVVEGPFPTSIIRGWDYNSMIHRITFENIEILGKKVLSTLDAHMVCEMATDVVFTDGAKD